MAGVQRVVEALRTSSIPLWKGTWVEQITHLLELLGQPGDNREGMERSCSVITIVSA